MESKINEKKFVKGDKWFLLSYKLGNRTHLTVRRVIIKELRKDGEIAVQTNNGIVLADESDLVKVVDLITEA